MSYRLYLRPQPPFLEGATALDEQVFSWVLLDASGDIKAHGQDNRREQIEHTLQQNDLEKVRLIGLVPGDQALFCVADIPAKQTRYVQQALPFAVEEQIAQDIDTVHLALGPRQEKGFRVAAIDRARMAYWYDMFSDWQGMQLEGLFADSSLLPIRDTDWALCLDGEHALMASRDGEWFRVRAENLSIFFQSIAAPPTEEVSAELTVTLYGSASELEVHQLVVDDIKQQSRIAATVETLDIMPIELIALSHHKGLSSPINLCQGIFMPRGQGKSPLKAWRAAAVIAGVWFVLQLGVETGLGIYHGQKAAEAEAQAMAVYRQYFPQDRRATSNNVRRILEGQLRAAGTQTQDADFLTLMKHTGQQYARLPGRDQVHFNNISYSRQRGELIVDVRADSFDKLNALRTGLGNSGLEARIGSVVNEPSGARGRLTVTGG
ncbi:MAG: type II secretion system protein GspL [Marinobacter sp.]|nr:type II secretion system protein GspL [Marinobacter sp.]